MNKPRMWIMTAGAVLGFNMAILGYVNSQWFPPSIGQQVSQSCQGNGATGIFFSKDDSEASYKIIAMTTNNGVKVERAGTPDAVTPPSRYPTYDESYVRKDYWSGKPMTVVAPAIDGPAVPVSSCGGVKAAIVPK